jgi:PIN domain nuclease of toxin-antitoxin system
MPTTVSNGLLLDTHALLWAVMDPDKLGSNARLAITAVGTQVRVSHVSLWELAIKRRLGKLNELDRPALEWFETNVSKSRFLVSDRGHNSFATQFSVLRTKLSVLRARGQRFPHRCAAFGVIVLPHVICTRIRSCVVLYVVQVNCSVACPVIWAINSKSLSW